MIRSAVREGSRVLVIAHRKELIDQIASHIERSGVPRGIIMAGYHARQAPVQVASLATLRRREHPDASLIFIDEAHHAGAKSYGTVLDKYPDVPVVGVTASPWRTDGKPLKGIFEESIVVSTPAELVAQGWLCPATGFTYSTPDLSEVRIIGSDYDPQGLGRVMSRVVGDIVGQWRARASDLSTVVFACTIEHSLQLKEAFGHIAEHIDGTTPKVEREAILARLASGETRVVCNVGVLTEGWDCPRVKCAVLARPTKSVGLYLQMVGRIRRPWGDITARIHDHGQCVMTHGLPDSERDYSLIPRKAKIESPSVRTCVHCLACYDASSIRCPLCMLSNPVVRKRHVETVEGEFVDFKNIEEHPIASHKVTTFLFLMRKKQEQMGYKSGWALWQFKNRYGRWPTKLERYRAGIRNPPADSTGPGFSF